MSVAALVRYNDDANGDVYFDNSLLPESIDPNHPDQFTVWADRSGMLARSEDWPDGLEIAAWTEPALEFRMGRVCPIMPCEFRACPSSAAKTEKSFPGKL